MTNQEILAPLKSQRGRDGRWVPGNNASPGRPGGVPNSDVKAIRDMVAEALKQAGGVDYLVMQAYLNPTAFMGLVGKTMPLKLTTEDGAPITLVVVQKEYVDAPKRE
jgi:hypothetical protein